MFSVGGGGRRSPKCPAKTHMHEGTIWTSGLFGIACVCPVTFHRATSHLSTESMRAPSLVQGIKDDVATI